MSLLSITAAQLAFGHVALLDHAHFLIEPGERVGLIGRNGVGKSSLLKIVDGLTKLDDGLISRAQALTTAYVPQEPIFCPSMCVFDTVAAGLKRTRVLLDEYNRVLCALADMPECPSQHLLLARMNTLQSKLDACDGWTWHTRVATTLTQLGLDSNALIDNLSGGVLKRVALARALVMQSDILLLDEPTNHLDFDSIRWLETLLLSLRSSVLFITHDRAFLDRVSTRIVELDRGRLFSYSGNFSSYQARKSKHLEEESIENARLDKLLAKEEIWIRKGIEARRTRNVARIESLVQMRNNRAKRQTIQDNVRLDVKQAGRSGTIVAKLINVNKRYGQHTVVSCFSTTVIRGDKIGFIGPNGVGKTTLLKLLLGEIMPDEGRVHIGTNLHIAYFDQMRTQLDPERSLIDTISPGGDWIELNGTRKHVMSYLGDFLFSPERATSPVKLLSGGERNRLLLARLFSRPANVLVLDEPTNDLDIPTLELLEELLISYTGTVLLVSHDRAFLDNVVTSVISAEGKGQWQKYVGSFWDWQIQKTRADVLLKADGALSEKAGIDTQKNSSLHNASSPAKGRNEKRRIKLTFNEQRELDALPDRIAQLEARQQSIATRLQNDSIFMVDLAESIRLTECYSALDEELLAALDRWQMLETKRNPLK
ncbi:ATP-binding cassette domain-containing protein [Candidatus Vallotia lariciata]|uniref:ATP-binding cassette domain-containing protein n=1 Tax=Candidatus Vallotia laricis TaxID=2018052 RepID=UPI001D008F19|nr:ATP-binding cassette domain-containing protein [Candidatus Vallotia lariciata]UDG83229.1 ABC transporter ATP-binding protein uup [Candidatus Vallotia lariciata]